ncbi:MAG TPA: hypothetical protein QGF05_10400 [Dehalococcoidia bacterium]|nr:hypothetical protein [Dehalococcoidia bacterium]
MTHPETDKSEASRSDTSRLASIAKPWQEPSEEVLRQIPAVLGVYELADAAGTVIHIGQAGGREPFGLRSKLSHHFSEAELNPVLREQAARFRWESNQQYTTRRIEMLMHYAEAHDQQLPPGNIAGTWEDQPTLGRIRRN